MDVSYRKNLNRSYICMEEQGQLIEPYELMMLENHRIPGLLPMQSVVADGRRRYLYEISGKQQIEDYFSGKKVGHDVLRLFLVSVQNMCRSLSEYLLREEGICLEIEFIYVDLEDGSLQFLYLPFYEKNLPQAFELCMEQLLRKIDHQDKEAVELGYQIYQLCAGGHADIGRLLEAVLGRQPVSEEGRLLTADGDSAWAEGKMGKRGRRPGSEEREREEESKGAEDSNGYNDRENTWKGWVEKNKAYAAGLLKKYVPELIGAEKTFLSGMGQHEQKRRPFFNRVKSRGKEASFWGRKQEKRKTPLSESTQISEGGACDDTPSHPTEILGVRLEEPLGRFTYQGIHQCSDIVVEGDSFLLGKNSNQVNGVISAEGVSRLHARVTRQEQKYYIEDLNSTNGTYINDMPLEYRQPKEIYPGDRIRFGAEEYMFS